MGRFQTEADYRNDASYLKSVLLWLQGYWAGPAVHVYPLKGGAPSVAVLSCPEDARFTKSTRRHDRSARVPAATKPGTMPSSTSCFTSLKNIGEPLRSLASATGGMPMRLKLLMAVTILATAPIAAFAQKDGPPPKPTKKMRKRWCRQSAAIRTSSRLIAS